MTRKPKPSAAAVVQIPRKEAEAGEEANCDDGKPSDRPKERGNNVNNNDGTKPVAEWKLARKKALLQFRCKLEDAIRGDYLLGRSYRSLSRSSRENMNNVSSQQPPLWDIALWGVPLLPSKGHEGTDHVLTNFLKARDYKAGEAFEMLQETLRWRRQHMVDEIAGEPPFGPDEPVSQMMYVRSVDRDGRPLCYHVYGMLEDRETYKRALGTKERVEEFKRWVVQLMEKVVRRLSFKDGGVHSLIQITDLKNMQSHSAKEMRGVLRSTFLTVQDHYPELVHRHIILNVPLWFYTFHLLLLRLLRQSDKHKFILARPAKVTKTLLKFIDPEDLPVEYGGLLRENDEEFSTLDKVSEVFVRGNTTKSIRIPIAEAGATVVWDVTVVGWDVSYKEEFVPDDEGSYKVLLHMSKKLNKSVRNSYYINEPGELVITVRNPTFKKKRVLYRTKFKPTVPMYVFFK
ncbi:patellin-4-like [Syzygium oleosum]|uniref:patellin-4-like n=1 Tax=Syzygium oleosum TaxID=219896 RepID=UPI0024B9DCE9|nr:patellin-4-like [Syzygium oleosum]